jgi:ubiquinone/menaquinone biosynthesis C-methylase UbiE
MKKATNPNDKTAHVYDIVNSSLKGAEVTDAEIKLVQKLLTPNGHILDIGAGTGRHAVRLVKLGYNLTALDSSNQMLDQLAGKKSNLKIIKKDIFSVNLKTHSYDLIMMMWNTFSEICLTKKRAGELLKKCKKLLKDNGNILINIDNPEVIDFSNLHFVTNVKKEKLIYKQDWKVIKYDEKTNTTISRELITIQDSDGKTLETCNSEIVQRWWTFEELSSLVKTNKVNFRVSLEKLKINNELYILLSL